MFKQIGQKQSTSVFSCISLFATILFFTSEAFAAIGLTTSNDGINVNSKRTYAWMPALIQGLLLDTDQNAGTITTPTVTHDATNIYYQYDYAGTPSFLRIQMDTDQNAATGYAVGGIGSDYLIENGNLFSYSGTGGNWGWTLVKAVTFTKTSTTAKWTVARADIGSPASLRLMGEIATPVVGSAVVTYAIPGVNVKTVYGAKGDGATDDTTAIQNALTNNDRVYVPAGTYMVGNLTLKTNNEIYGDGATSILKQRAQGAYVLSANPGSAGTANPANNMTNLKIHNIKLLGRAGVDPFYEHTHLLNLNAVTGVTVDNVDFVGYVGDGIYLGSGNVGGSERHNYNVTINNSRFDGLVKSNRNGITVVDGTDIVIQYSSFTRSGKYGMPAGIDIEPDPVSRAFSHIKRITMDHLTFTDMGPVAMIFINLEPNDKVTNPAQDITISNVNATGSNVVGQSGVLALIAAGNNDNATASTPPLNLLIKDSTFDSVQIAFAFSGLRGIEVRDTTFKNTASYGWVGFWDNTQRPRDVTFKNVKFQQMGMSPTYGQSALRVYGVDYLTLDTCTFENNNATDGSGGFDLYFYGNPVAVSTNVKLLDTKITNILGRSSYGIRVTNHTLTPSTNTQSGTVMTGVTGNDFSPANTP